MTVEDVVVASYRSITSDDMLAGWPAGLVPPGTSTGAVVVGTPAEALVSVIERRLSDRPCFVEFSGGCDSSLVLAATVEACQRAGHAPPIAVTDRFDAPGTDESAFQEAMVAHLGLQDWIVRRPDGGTDLLGTRASTFLATHGVMWPATLAARADLLDELRGSLVLSGEGGDEVFGLRRASPLLVLAPAVRARRHRRNAVWFMLRSAHASARYAAGNADNLPWLHGQAQRRVAAATRRERRAQPFAPGRVASGHLLRRRSTVIGLHNLSAHAAAHDVEWLAPLLDPTFIARFEAGVAWHEYRGRNYLLNRYFADLLPQVIRSRTTKASFNSVAFGEGARSFAASWDGRGLPDDVDADWLARDWREPAPHAGTALLLQAAWLASQTNRGIE